MRRDDSDGDVRLRNSARASLERLEAEVDPAAAWVDFRAMLGEGRHIGGTPAERRPLARRLAAVAVLVLVAGAATALIVHDGESRTATVVPSPTDTGTDEGSTDGPSPIETATAGPVTSIGDVSQAPAELVALLGRTWVITSADGQPRAFAAHFEMSSGHAVGHDGCNFYDSTMQLDGIADGATSMQVVMGESTAAQCVPPYDDGWSAPSGRYRVDGDTLTITAADGSILQAVDLESLPIVTSADDLLGEWSVPDGTDIEFADDGTIRLPCAAVGTWTFTDALHTTIDQAAAIAGCANDEIRSLSWTFDALLSGTPAVRRLADGSLLFGSSQLGHIVKPTSAPPEPVASTGDLLRPFVEPADCVPLSTHGDGDAIGSTFDLHLFAWPTQASSFPIQIIGDPTGGPTAPFALVQRYPDRTDFGERSTIAINDWDVALQVGPNNHDVITGDARWDLPDGGQGYVRSRGIDRDTLIAIISSLTTRDASAAIPGFDYSPTTTIPSTLQLVVEHLNTGVYGRSATLQCQATATNFLYRITSLDGDAVFQYALVIDRSVPLEVGYQEGTLVVIEGNEDPTAPKVGDVFNADVTTWDGLLAG